MIKKGLLFLLLVACCLLLVTSVQAAATATSSGSESGNDERVRKLIDTIAKNAKLISERRGIIGVVTDATNTQITITDMQNNTRFVDVDELTKFTNPSAKGAFGISDITKDATVGILGLYNKESRRILARFVDVMTVPVIIHGGVSAVDSDNYTVNVATEEGKQVAADVENLTRTYSYTQKDGFAKSGFSKIKINFNIIAIGVLDKTNKNKLVATRIIIFPEIPPSPKVNSALERIQKSK